MNNSDDVEALRLEIERRNDARGRDDPGLLINDAMLRDLARRPLLGRNYVVALLQGFMPPTDSPINGYTYLGDYADAVERLIADVDSGKLIVPCKPAELVAWARSIPVELPEGFVKAVNVDLPQSDVLSAELAQTTASIVEPSAAAGGTSDRLTRQVATESRPADKAKEHFDFDPDLQARANEMAAAVLKAKGRHPTKASVAMQLAKVVGREPATVARRIRNRWKPDP